MNTNPSATRSTPLLASMINPELLEPEDSQRGSTRSPRRSRPILLDGARHGSGVADQSAIIQQLMQQNDKLMMAMHSLINNQANAPAAAAAPSAASADSSEVLPMELKKDLRILAQNLLKQVQRKTRVESHIMKHIEDIDVLHNTEGWSHGSRAFKSPPEFSQLDGIASECVNDDCNVSFTLPKGTSRRSACELFHRHCMTWCMQVELEAHRCHLAELLPRCTMLQCTADALLLRPKELNAINLEEPARPPFPMHFLRLEAESAYSWVVGKLRADADKESQRKSQEDERKKRNTTRLPQQNLKLC
jgi:hypothetical protein